jgi:hypothetical protein
MPDPGEASDRPGFAATVFLVFAASLLLALMLSTPARAGDIERAKRIHDRLVGIPPDQDRLDEIVQRLQDDGATAAARYALEHPVFYSSTLKNMIAPWTNAEQSRFVPLNDFTATVIGMIRDEVPFNSVLSADLVYIARNGVVDDGYSQRNNRHYDQIEDDRVDLSDKIDFIGVPQSSLGGSQLDPGDTAGVLTTRAAAEAYFSAGTNRRMLRFTMMNFICRDLEALHDTALPSDWIRQDVTRSPGGDSSIFLNSCVGCHTGMDPMAGAFAYFEWEPGDEDDDRDNGRLVHTPGAVQPKYLINAKTFTFGYETTSNRWENRWLQGKNSALGWPSIPKDGYGAKSLGQAIANSDAFATCQVEQVFEQVCFRPDLSNADRAAIDQIASDFKTTNNYSLKQVFAEVANYCTLPDAS